jgi:transcription antitermination factor NusG
MEGDLRSCRLSILLLLAIGLPVFSQFGRPMPGGRARIPSTSGATVPNVPLATFTGAVQNIDKKKLTLQEADSKTLQFVCSRKTQYYDGDKKVKSSDIKPGDQVTVETKRFADGEMEAINVHIERPKAPKAEAPKAS